MIEVPGATYQTYDMRMKIKRKKTWPFSYVTFRLVDRCCSRVISFIRMVPSSLAGNIVTVWDMMWISNDHYIPGHSGSWCSILAKLR